MSLNREAQPQAEIVMATVIKLEDHPSNLDPTARLVRWTGPGVYRVAAGYVAALPHAMCIDGHFCTADAAKAAQDEYTQLLHKV